MSLGVRSPWEALPLEHAVRLFEQAPFRWFVTGGHALELYAGRSWRGHGDIDVSVLRRDLDAVWTWLSAELELHVAAAGVLTRWDGGALSADRHENNIWCTRPGAPHWQLDLTISDGDEHEWVYRRDESLRQRWPQAVLFTADGVPYLAPELQLLYKAADPRPKDLHDFQELAPALRASGKWDSNWNALASG